MTPFHRKAKLLVRVNGKAGMVKLRITILKNGKTHTYIRFVPANRKLAVKNLTIPAKDRQGDGEADRPLGRTARPVGWGGPLRRASPASGP